MSKPTPGPWEWYTSNSYARLGSKLEYRELLYPVMYSDGQPGIEWKSDADACLIVEAPGLLSMVKQYLALAADPLPDRAARRRAELDEQARAAIIRIDGELP